MPGEQRFATARFFEARLGRGHAARLLMGIPGQPFASQGLGHTCSSRIMA